MIIYSDQFQVLWKLRNVNIIVPFSCVPLSENVGLVHMCNAAHIIYYHNVIVAWCVYIGALIVESYWIPKFSSYHVQVRGGEAPALLL